MPKHSRYRSPYTYKAKPPVNDSWAWAWVLLLLCTTAVALAWTAYRLSAWSQARAESGPILLKSEMTKQEIADARRSQYIPKPLVERRK